MVIKKGGGGEDFLENSLIWEGHNKMLLGGEKFQQMQFDSPLQLSTEEYVVLDYNFENVILSIWNLHVLVQ